MEKKDGAKPIHSPWGSPTSSLSGSDAADSSAGSHVEWCKQLIAATLTSQISRTVQPDVLTRDSKISKRLSSWKSDDEELYFHEEYDLNFPSSALNRPTLGFGAPVKLSPNQVPLLPGETVQITVKDVMYICPFSGLITGTLTVTDYKLYFISLIKESSFILDINFGAISRLETISVPNQGDNTKGIELVCKDIRSARFAYKTDESQPEMGEMLSKHAFPLSYSLPLFAFKYNEQFPVDGWKVYDPAAEYNRQLSLHSSSLREHAGYLSDGSETDGSSPSPPSRKEAPTLIKTTNNQILEVKSPVKHSKQDKNENTDCDKAYLDELVELHKRLMTLREGHILQQIVNLIEETGHFHITNTTFDFDLCSLDRSTVRKLQSYLETSGLS
ncbi:hypothetical protein ILYODFUR_002535 [Ilyodon furcidens]|uniref:GRAM domain-containing protein n=1 Tax=Ilyodon furcidens TaxID=33524 RepID=A0ABV0VC75_9TELE